MPAIAPVHAALCSRVFRTFCSTYIWHFAIFDENHRVPTLLNQYTAAPRRFSVRGSLLSVVLACTLPAVAVVVGLLYVSFDTKRTLLESHTSSLAREAMARLERDLAIIEAALRLLATSSALQDGDMRRFQRQAEDALPSGIVLNYVLTDRSGQQLVNTLVSSGRPLPSQGTPPALQEVFEQRATVLTDLFRGPVTGKPTIAMGVPVVKAGEVVYSLNVGMQPQRIDVTLRSLDLPPGWLVAVIDRSGTIVGRSRDSEQFVGQPAVPELAAALRRAPEGLLRARTKEGDLAITAHITSARWGWSVAVGAPEAQLHATLVRQMRWAAIGVLLALVFGVGLAWRLSRRILVSVQQLNEQAEAIVDGRVAPVPALQMAEAHGVSVVMQRAAAAMDHAVFQAQHDPLTGLGNRAYLEAQAPRMLSLARRLGLPSAVVMLDLDGFKAVNDRHGHAAGDRVLQAAAQRILGEVREEDVAVRLGGDEFCVVLSNADEPAAMLTAMRIIHALSQPYGNMDERIGCSAGVALLEADKPNLLAAIEGADKALYVAKLGGKGRVELHRPQVGGRWSG